ncbi:hypothetical protein [Rhizobium laguerreae]|uniref:hypothetical protein n=1 Tax=Rhizobium laguerreae TaxID=1076926 RepID=UPI001C928D85|nr:hypothetical protein [Rhizobium laguerreae]MBY3441807.1 hypothetical protein [Rhizobium laguerreae]
MTATPTIHWRTEWSDGSPTHLVSLCDASAEQCREIELAAEHEGILIEGDSWTTTANTKLIKFFQVARLKGFRIEFEREEGGALNLQRLKLDPTTRVKLETMPNFTMVELAGSCPVQAQGHVDGHYWYFRARGAEWRLEIGGNENGTKAPGWWHGEEWPTDDGFGAGYLTDEEAIACILRAVELYRTEDRSRFENGHPDYERTMLDGWSYGSLNLQHVVKRLGLSGPEVVERAKSLGIEIPFTAEMEIAALGKPLPSARAFDRASGEWIDLNVGED